MLNKINYIFAAGGLCFITTAQAATLIQCPDWRSLVPQTTMVTLAKHAPKVAFDTKLAQNTASKVANGSSLATPKTTRGKTASVSSCPVYKVKRGDTLAKISRTFLGSSKRYPELMAANKSRVTSTTDLKVGTVLTIPCDLRTAKINKPKRNANGARGIAADTRIALAKPGTSKPKETFNNN